MVYEFYGSILALSMVAACSLLIRQKFIGVLALHIILAIPCIALHQISFLPFIIGSFISFSYCRYPSIFNLSAWMIGVLSLVTLAGYSVNNKYALAAASAASMFLLLGVPALATQLSGKTGLFLGRLSFPLYLVHALVLLSVTSIAYPMFVQNGYPNWVSLTFSLALTWIASILAALPFMSLETFWVQTLNRWMHAFIKRAKPPAEIWLSRFSN